MNRLTLLTTLLAGVAGCSLPQIGGGTSTATPAAQAGAGDVANVEEPVVQVRDYWRSSVVSIVAWDVNESGYGLRTNVTRSGELAGGARFGDHRLYITPLYASDMGGFVHSKVMPDQILLGTGWHRDNYSCFYGRPCSPMTTVGVRVPDALLRAHRDSLVVTFFPRVRDPWTITLRRELIAAYLAKVDSVVADMSQS